MLVRNETPQSMAQAISECDAHLDSITEFLKETPNLSPTDILIVEEAVQLTLTARASFQRVYDALMEITV